MTDVVYRSQFLDLDEKSGKYVGKVDGQEAVVEMLQDGTLGVQIKGVRGTSRKYQNDKGDYHVADLGDKGGRWFVNLGVNNKNQPYARVRPAPDRPKTDTGTRPQSYGKK